MNQQKLEILRERERERERVILLKPSLGKKTLFKIQKLYIKYKNLKDGLCKLLHNSS